VDLSFADAIETPSRFSYPIGRLDRLCWQSDQSPPEGHDAVVPVRRPGRAGRHRAAGAVPVSRSSRLGGHRAPAGTPAAHAATVPV